MNKLIAILILISPALHASEIAEIVVNAPADYTVSVALKYTATDNTSKRSCYDKVWDGKAFKYKKVPKLLEASAQHKILNGTHYFSGTDLKLKRDEEKCQFELSHIGLRIHVEGVDRSEHHFTILEDANYNNEVQEIKCDAIKSSICTIDNYSMTLDGYAKFYIYK